ncbi:chromodomain Y-like protein [Mizuhopecten yessoensis]|uniref:Chromodomain Y-like protein n=1 Tax=Mizuhopecten yessoensis TaxID=6573 RepID=A0A210PE82_MIZYE|nr:chromodomain Y-like protein [Mizuhopecten yessoensis]OWF34766.1 Chromodomain Y-like protein [Mizuhopecten yessoensis]
MADNEIYEVEHALDRRVNDTTLEYLIRWKGFNEEWDTWEPLENLLDCLHLLKDFEEKNGGKAQKSSSAKLKDEAHDFAMELISKNIQHKKFEAKSKSTSPKQASKHVQSPKSTKSPEKGKNVHVAKDGKLSPSPSKKIVKNYSVKRKAEDTDSSPRQPATKKKKVSIEGKIMSQGSAKKKVNGKAISPNSGKTKASKVSIEGKGNSPVPSKKKILKKTESPSLKKERSDKEKKKSVSLKKSSEKKATKRPSTSLSTTDNKGTKKRKTVTSVKGISKSTGKKKDSSNAAKKVLKKSKKIAQEKVKTKKTVKNIKTKGSPKPTKTENVKKKENKTLGKEECVALKKMPSLIKTKGFDSKQSQSKHFSMKIKLKSLNSSPKSKSQVSRQKETKKSEHSKDCQNDKGTGTYELEECLKKIRAKKKQQKNVKDSPNDIEVIDMDSDEKSDSSGDEQCLSSKKVCPKSKDISWKVVANKSVLGNKNDSSVSVKAVGAKVQGSKESSPTTPGGKRILQVKISPLRTTDVPRKKLHLIDSIKSKKVMLPLARPVSPTPLFTTVKPMSKASVIKTSPSAASSSANMESLCGDVPAYQYFPAVIPVSPSSMSYRMFLDRLPQQLKPKGGKRVENGDSPPEEMERRISVRQSECAFRYKDIVVKKCSKYTQIWMNTHTKIKNALNPQVIQEICSALNSAKYDDSNLVMFSGLGNVFCQGLDLHYLVRGDKRVASRQMVDALRDFTKSLITFPKPIVAVVTGPAVGLGMTMLPLCDVVYASDKATFHLPYAQLAQTPEGGATFSIPSAIGMAMANELLIAGRKITAIEACQLGLVSQVFWPTSIMQEVIPRIQNMASMSGKALETTKLLIRSHQRTKLELTNESESNLLLERWPSFETQKAIESYLSNEKNFITT